MRAEFLDDVVDAEPALVARLEVDDELAVVGAAEVGSGGAADAGHERIDIGIARDRIGDLLLIVDHLVIRGALLGFGDDVELIGVLIRDEAFGDLDEHVHRRAQDEDEAGHHGQAVAKNELQGTVVDPEHTLKESLGHVVKPAALLFVPAAQEAAAEHGRKGYGDHPRDQDGDRDGYGKFLEQAAENAAEEQHRDEHGGERERHGDDREADFAGAAERSAQGLLA